MGNVAMRPPVRGARAPVGTLRICAWILGVTVASREVFADGKRFTPTAVTPDPPARGALHEPALRPSWDLDGIYLWLGPTGAASHVDGMWDSTIGASATVVRVREREPVGLVGGSFGASRWTERGGGRLWLDAVVGTRLGGRMAGVSAGPILEVSEMAHPRVGGSLGVWAFVGLTPFARVGAVEGMGVFAEVGVHFALPVLRH
jgi:hypothetical protein